MITAEDLEYAVDVVSEVYDEVLDALEPERPPSMTEDEWSALTLGALRGLVSAILARYPQHAHDIRLAEAAAFADIKRIEAIIEKRNKPKPEPV